MRHLIFATLIASGPAAAESGGELYRTNCAPCHGAELQGEPDWRTPDGDGYLPAPPHDASGNSWRKSDRQLFTYTKIGGEAVMARRGVRDFPSAMPAFDGALSDAEITAILEFIKSTWPADKRAYQAGLN